jgi:streptogramin lyase
METMRRRYLLTVSLLVLLLVAGVFTILRPTPASGCPSFLNGLVVKSELASRTFGAVTTFSLPSPERWPNAIEVAPDGSVWFAEESVPALAHLFATNGTLVEYAFPGSYPTGSSKGYSCADKTDIWGVALWDGRVWATDSAQNRLVGLSPTNDTFKLVSLSANDSFPYTLTLGPDGALWFTQINSGQIGTLFANGTVVEHPVKVTEHLNGTSASPIVPGVPAQIAFSNSSLGYYVDASPLISGSPVFAFNPERFSPEPVAAGNLTLSDPDSISLGNGGIWLAQHGDSSLAFVHLADGTLTVYPTSSVGYIGTTLPYFVETNGSLVWFNEHFGNRMAVIDFPSRTLTEYSLSDPAAANMSQLANALTFALGGERAWFTESSSDAIGYVNASYRPSFSIAANLNSTLSIHKGGSLSLQLSLQGDSTSPISFRFSDSSSTNSTEGNITMTGNVGGIDSLAGNQSLNVTVHAGLGAPAGRYTLLVTATDGLTSRSIYVELSVLP